MEKGIVVGFGTQGFENFWIFLWPGGRVSLVMPGRGNIPEHPGFA